MKRFYKLVSIEKRQEGYAVLLDGRAIKTESGTILLAQNEQVATKIMQEWAEQNEQINPDTMPFTQILNTRIDNVAKQRQAMSNAIMKFLNTDLICYPAQKPKALHDLQEKHWSKWRKWAEQHFNVPMKVTTGLQALIQDPALHKAIKAYIDKVSDDIFTLLQVAVPLCGSLVLGLALIEGKASADEIFECCFTEEHYKEKIYFIDEYGRDPLSEHRQQSCLRDLKACETYRIYLT